MENKIDLDELERLAKDAGSGDWTLRVHTSEPEDFDPKSDDWTISHGGKEVVAWEQDGIQKQEFVRFMAAANPAVILELIRMAREK